MSDIVYSVSQLNREARRLLAQHFLTVTVGGEISNLSQPASGHLYFTLKDAQAQVRCAMFRTQLQRCRFKPENGLQVIARAEVSLYEPRGDYQLVVEHLEAGGDGALRQAYERLLQQLQTEGLFDNQRKLPLPLIPRQIGIITSPSGAAIHDMLTVLKRRFPAIPVIVYPVAVQGEAAKFEIAQALATANQRAEVDVLLLGRGGGSLEDLWAFNEVIVARAIAASQIPVISGVGHEVDVTISDFVADFRAATPSAAAEHAVPLQADWLYGFKQLEKRLLHNLQRLLTQNQQQLNWRYKALLQLHPGQQLRRNAQRLDELEQRLRQAQQQHVRHLQQRWSLLDYRLQQVTPLARLRRQQQQLREWQRQLTAHMLRQLLRQRDRQQALSQTLQAVSPLATLARGYSISLLAETDTIVKSTQQVQVGDRLHHYLTDGQLITHVQEIIHAPIASAAQSDSSPVSG